MMFHWKIIIITSKQQQKMCNSKYSNSHKYNHNKHLSNFHLALEFNARQIQKTTTIKAHCTCSSCVWVLCEGVGVAAERRKKRQQQKKNRGKNIAKKKITKKIRNRKDIAIRPCKKFKKIMNRKWIRNWIELNKEKPRFEGIE